MGIVETDKWLEKDLDHPLEICKQLLDSFSNIEEKELYSYLKAFGMYKPGRQAKATFQVMKQNNVWSKLDSIFNKYRQLWNGPNIPIYLFPIDGGNSLFRKTQTKSGLSFPDKLFIFISELGDEKELEAVFIHEYHHTCRLKALNKPMEDYSLLDSIILEGLAEFSVLYYCGKDYLADWCNLYSEKTLLKYWDSYLEKNLNTTRQVKLHDQLLFGKGGYPQLLGYAAGYHLVKNFYKDKNYSSKISFTLPCTEIYKKNK